MLTKAIQALLIILAFIMPIIGHITVNSSTVFKNENRTAFKYPTVFNNAYWDDLQKALNDRLFLRYDVQALMAQVLEHTLTEHSDFDPSIGFKLPGTLRGWYFMGDGFDYAYKKHTAQVNEESKNLEKNLLILKYLKGINKDHTYFVVGPDKASVYPELMNPYLGYPGKYRYLDTLKDKIAKDGITLIDNQDAIIETKDLSYKTSSYLTNDTHWNKYGAYHAFVNTFKTILGEDFKPLPYTFTYSRFLYGDLNRNLEISMSKDTHDFAHSHNPIKAKLYVKDMINGIDKEEERFLGESVPQLCKDGADKCNVQYSKNEYYQSPLKVAIISDSFGTYFRNFAVDHFKEVLWLWEYDDVQKIYKYTSDFKPDLIIYLRVERNIQFSKQKTQQDLQNQIY